MYAVIATGGKQYTVRQGQVLRVEKLPVEVGQKVEFDQVLLLADGEKFQVGAPFIKDAKVRGEVVKQGRGDKVRILKFRRRKHHMKQQGHRQSFTEVAITGLQSIAEEK